MTIKVTVLIEDGRRQEIVAEELGELGPEYLARAENVMHEAMGKLGRISQRIAREARKA